ncbi:LuxR family transcriptional regulator [Fusibacter ferrireducens]|uniref:LuxR family transcriptional regulator n=1 Tax=Fusibacter ferrireducens TaxID=2785058 RepID=UPI001A9B478A|nr:LuxR family transcriptional regulator [Fusibacter ferrireducens]
MGNNFKAFVFGISYSVVISFCLFGPLSHVLLGQHIQLGSFISLFTFIMAFLNPKFKELIQRGMLFLLMGIAILVGLSGNQILLINLLMVGTISFFIASICRSFTIVAVSTMAVNESEKYMGISFGVAFSVLYMINVSYTVIHVTAAKIILMSLIIIAYIAHKRYLEKALIEVLQEAPPQQGKNAEGKVLKVIIPAIALILVYIGGGISYAGIYPYFKPFRTFDQFYNVLPLIGIMPVAIVSGKYFNNLSNLALGIICLMIALSGFMLKLSLISYLVVQTFLQIGWGFTNVFAFSYAWRLAKRYRQYGYFGYFIICILLGVIVGSGIAATVLNKHLDSVYLGLATFTPMLIGLVLIFYHEFGWTHSSGVQEYETGQERDAIQDHDIAQKRDQESDQEHSSLSADSTYDLFLELPILKELTSREKETIYFYYRGDTAIKISEHLNVSPNTVRTHIKRAYTKLEITKKQELRDLIESEMQ